MRVRAPSGSVDTSTERTPVMSTTTEPDTTPTVEEELHELEAQEAALERRTRSLELSGPLTLILSIVAVAIGVGALIIALANGSGDTSTMSGTSMGPGSAAKPSTAAMMGAAGHGRFTSSMMGAAAQGKVYVQLGDYWVAPAVSSVRAGKVTFIANNVGRIPHELMVERMPMKFDAPMRPNEEAAQGMIEDMDPGKGGQMTMRLRPGTYMLFCNLPRHYVAGQHTTFTVTE